MSLELEEFLLQLLDEESSDKEPSNVGGEYESICSFICLYSKSYIFLALFAELYFILIRLSFDLRMDPVNCLFAWLYLFLYISDF